MYRLGSAFHTFFRRKYRMTRRTFLLTALPLLLAALAIACDGTHTPAQVSTAPSSSVATGTSSASDLHLDLVHSPWPIPTPPPQPPSVPPTYNDAYENCLFAVAAAGGSSDTQRTEANCDGFAKQQSHTSRPAWSAEVEHYFECLFFFAMRGTRGVSGDIKLICHGPVGRID
jgi:hypothetical protein